LRPSSAAPAERTQSWISTYPSSTSNRSLPKNSTSSGTRLARRTLKVARYAYLAILIVGMTGLVFLLRAAGGA
jgi:hypothetical protein